MAVGPSAAYQVTPWCQGPLKSSWEPCAVRSHGRPCSGGTPPITLLSPPCRVGARGCRDSAARACLFSVGQVLSVIHQTK